MGKICLFGLCISSRASPMESPATLTSLVTLAEEGCIKQLAMQESKFALIRSFLEKIPYRRRFPFIARCLESNNLLHAQKIKIMDTVTKSPNLYIGEYEKDIMGFLLGEAKHPGALSADSLRRAIVQENMPAIYYLVEVKKVSVAQPTTYHKYPLHYAVEQDNEEIVEYLCERGANASDKDDEGYAPLHLVKSVEVAKILLQHGANIHAHAGTTQYRTNSIDIAKLSQRKDLDLFLRQARGDRNVVPINAQN